MEPKPLLFLVYPLPVVAILSGCLLATGAGRTPVSTEVVGTFPCASTAGTYTSFDFPTPPNPAVPCNVDTDAVGKAQNVEQEQRFFDICSWQSLLARARRARRWNSRCSPH